MLKEKIIRVSQVVDNKINEKTALTIRKVLQDELDISEKVVLDFSDIDSINVDIVSIILGELIFEYSPKVIADRVSCINLKDDDVVIYSDVFKSVAELYNNHICL